MNAKAIVPVALLVLLMFSGCVMVPGPGGPEVVVVPPLPQVVVLNASPYYVYGGYRYYYHDNGWFYAHPRGGPWVELPRDHYPREVRFRGEGGERHEWHGR